MEAIRTIGGFDESLQVGEDVDLVWRLGETDPPGRVRYEPAAKVGHDQRTAPGAWLSRRVDYGTSAAPLAVRHHDALAPVSLSPWSAAAWGLVAVGHPLIGAGVAAVSTGLLAQKLSHLSHPWVEAVRLAGVGNVAAGRLLADAVRRAWWPAAGLALTCGPRSLRRSVAAAFLVPPLVEWFRERTPLDPVTYALLRVSDDVSYGLGVWIGCVRENTIAPLVPDLTAGRVRRTAPGSIGSVVMRRQS